MASQLDAGILVGYKYCELRSSRFACNCMCIMELRQYCEPFEFTPLVTISVLNTWLNLL